MICLLENFPLELIRKIFSYLNHEELKILSLVSKKFLQVASDDILWKDLFFSSRLVLDGLENLPTWKKKFQKRFYSRELFIKSWKSPSIILDLSQKGAYLKDSNHLWNSVQIGDSHLYPEGMNRISFLIRKWNFNGIMFGLVSEYWKRMNNYFGYPGSGNAWTTMQYDKSSVALYASSRMVFKEGDFIILEAHMDSWNVKFFKNRRFVSEMPLPGHKDDKIFPIVSLSGEGSSVVLLSSRNIPPYQSLQITKD